MLDILKISKFSGYKAVLAMLSYIVSGRVPRVLTTLNHLTFNS